jgi:hypothetical protein
MLSLFCWFTARNQVSLLLLLTATLSVSTTSAAEQGSKVSSKPAAQPDSAQVTKAAQPSTRLEQSRLKVLQALQTLESELKRQKDFDVAECRKKLRCEDLAAEVASARPNLTTLHELSHCFYGTDPHLAHPAVVRLREPAAQFIQDAMLARYPNLPAEYNWHVEQVIKQLAADPTARNEDALRRHAAWLRWLGDTPDLQQAQRQANHPNVVIAVRKELLTPHLLKVKQNIKETKFASRVIVGAQVTGQVHVEGSTRPYVDFTSAIPKVRIRYTGTTRTPNSQAVSGPVTVYNQSVTSIDANSDISWNGQQLVATPTVARCATTVTQLGLTLNQSQGLFAGGFVDRMVQNIAQRRASGQRGQAEFEISQLTQRDVTKRMDAQVTKLITSLNGQIEKYFIKPATRAGIHPSLQLATQKEFITFGLKQFDDAHMAADTPPNWKPMEGGVIVGLHQSALTGFTHKLCGGALWHDNEIADLQRSVMGIRSEALKIGNNPRWALQLDWIQPFSMQIDTDNITFTVRAQAITYNGKTLRSPIRIHAKYRLEAANMTLNGLRQGDVEVACLGTEGSAATRGKVEEFLGKKFSGFFEKHVFLDGITIPTGERWDSLSTFYVGEVQSSPGWLYLAIREKESGATRLVQQKLKPVGEK